MLSEMKSKREVLEVVKRQDDQQEQALKHVVLES